MDNSTIIKSIAPYADAVRSKVLKPEDLLKRIKATVKKTKG